MTAHGPRYGTVDRDYGMKLATAVPADDGPVWMVNLMKYREVANYTDGRDSVISGREADDRYSPLDSLAAVGVVMGCQPMLQPEPPEGFVQVDWSEVPHPPTDEDGPVMVVHILRFHDAEAADQTPTHMEQYSSEAAKVALGHGVRIAGWFAVEGTIIGDGRAWHQARFNLFPSKAAFMAVVTDPARLAAQKDHREVAIADTYTMIVRPSRDDLAASINDEADAS